MDRKLCLTRGVSSCFGRFEFVDVVDHSVAIAHGSISRITIKIMLDNVNIGILKLEPTDMVERPQHEFTLYVTLFACAAAAREDPLKLPIL